MKIQDNDQVYCHFKMNKAVGKKVIVIQRDYDVIRAILLDDVYDNTNKPDLDAVKNFMDDKNKMKESNMPITFKEFKQKFKEKKIIYF